MLSLYNIKHPNEKIDIEWIRKNSVIIHYCGRKKPWKENYMGSLGIFYSELVQ